MVGQYRFAGLLLMGALAVGCGEDSNINGMLFTSDDKTNTIEDMLDDAEKEYNLGNFDEAEKLAMKAYNKSSTNERANVLMGFIHLSKAGVDGFQLAKKLIDQSTTSAVDSATGTTSSSSCEGSSGAVKALCGLGDIIGLSAADLETLTQAAIASTDYYSAAKAREASLAMLSEINKAIKFVCPFVDETAKILVDADHASADSRHESSVCVPSEGTKLRTAKAHFLWAFSHLAEGIVFYTVFSQQLEPIQSSITNVDTSDPLKFISTMSEISSSVDKLMPTDETKSADSMLSGIFNDFEVAGKAFALIAGMPASITSSVTDALTELKAATEKITTTGVDSSSAALKDQFTAEITTEVTSKVTDSNGNLTDLGNQIAANSEQKTQFCDSYSQITTSELQGLCN